MESVKKSKIGLFLIDPEHRDQVQSLKINRMPIKTDVPLPMSEIGEIIACAMDPGYYSQTDAK